MTNPLTPFKSIFLFLYNDIKEDIKCLREILKGTYKPNYTIKEFFTFDKSFIRESWLFFLIIILAFCAGYFFSAVVYSNECNEIIMNMTNLTKKVITPYVNMSFNITP